MKEVGLFEGYTPYEEAIPPGVSDYSPTEPPTLTVKDMPADLQPRERAKRFGMNSLSNSELFAIILRTGTSGYPITDLCCDLMKMNDNLLLNLERKNREQIMEIKGIGELKALQIEAVMEIVRRYSRERIGDRFQVTSPQSIYELMRPEIANLPYEEMWAIYLNRSNHVIGKLRISEGGSTGTVFDIKKIIRSAILSHAEGIALCHNHPSGNLRPSGPDDNITRSFAAACRTLDIRLIDHLIVTTDGYYSYNDSSSILQH